MSSVTRAPWLALVGLLIAGCSPGGNAVPAATPAPAISLAGLTLVCGTATVFGPATVSVNPSIGSGSALPLSSTCPEGALASVSFAPSVASRSIGPNAEVVISILPNASTTATAVASADTTGFAADVTQSDVPFSTPLLGPGTALYVWLTQLEPQGD